MDSYEQCSVCIEPMNKSTRKSVNCGMCNYSACRECYKHYILGINENPHCMNCKKIWNHSMMTSNFDKKFVNTKYKKHRENILVEKELSKLVLTQPFVEKLMRNNKLKDDIREMKEQKKILEQNINDALIKFELNKRCEDRKVFIRKCTSNDCKGFLSSQWKCGLCSNWSCPDCHVVVGLQRGMDGNVDHVCNADLLATAKLLDSDTKMCPKCSVGIFKIDGCDMMFCTECHTSFSWKTGKIEMGVIHNPHYFEWLRKGGGTVERNPNEILCGRELDTHYLSRLHRHLKQFNHVLSLDMIQNLYGGCRGLIHLREIDLGRFRINDIEDNLDLRMKYMMNVVSSDTFKRTLQFREKQRERKREYFDVLSMFISCQTELCYRMLEIFSTGNLLNSIEGDKDVLCLIQALSLERENLVEYCNDCLSNISKTFGGLRFVLNKTYGLTHFKNTSK